MSSGYNAMKPQVSTYIWPGQVHFGFGAVGRVAEEVKTHCAKYVFVIADPGVVAAGLVESIAAPLKAADLPFEIYDKVVPNPDTQSVGAAVEAFRVSGADLIIGIGGGSGLDTAKAVRLVAGAPPEGHIAEYSPFLEDAGRPTPLSKDMPPLIAIPTTAGTGSEVTPWALIVDREAKCKFGAGGTPATVPTVALVDPQLTLTLPAFITAATGVDALSHCIEAYVSTNDNPMLDPMILFGIELIGRSLRTAVARGENHAARRDVMQAALIGGVGITSKWLGACHSLAHPLSSLADIQHGVANALMLSHQMAYSLTGALNRYARIGQALCASYPVIGTIRQRAEKAVEAVQELVVDTGLPTRLQDVGVTKKMIPELAAGAFHDPNWVSNPRSVSQADLEQLFLQAF
jgi:alcohol dehydrogenase class IV